MIEAFLLVGSHVKSLAIGGQQWLKPCHWLVALLEAVPLAGFNSEQMLVPQHFKLTTLWQLEYKMRQYDLAACLFFCTAWRCPEFFLTWNVWWTKNGKRLKKTWWICSAVAASSSSPILAASPQHAVAAGCCQRVAAAGALITAAQGEGEGSLVSAAAGVAAAAKVEAGQPVGQQPGPGARLLLLRTKVLDENR